MWQWGGWDVGNWGPQPGGRRLNRYTSHLHLYLLCTWLAVTYKYPLCLAYICYHGKIISFIWRISCLCQMTPDVTAVLGNDSVTVMFPIFTYSLVYHMFFYWPNVTSVNVTCCECYMLGPCLLNSMKSLWLLFTFFKSSDYINRERRHLQLQSLNKSIQHVIPTAYK